MDRYASQGDLPSCFRPCEPLARRSLLGNFDLKEGPSHTLSVVLLLQERTQKQWRWLLIDEYQDCNPLQAGTVGGDYGFVCLRECLVHVELVPCMGNNESTSTRLCAQVGTWQVQFIHVKGVSREQGRKVCSHYSSRHSVKKQMHEREAYPSVGSHRQHTPAGAWSHHSGWRRRAIHLQVSGCPGRRVPSIPGHVMPPSCNLLRCTFQHPSDGSEPEVHMSPA
eukprot:479458-Pelagomonas_calceolata.AAC.1